MVKNALINQNNERLIFDIRRFSTNDGPGIRTTIFMKSCPLACLWCHNPEGMSAGIEKLYSRTKCIGCHDCVDVCEQEAITLTRDGILTDRELCVLCEKCAEVCPSKATEMSAQYYSIDQLLGMIARERPFLEQSGGGVTLSGGEPLIEPAFTFELLDACGEMGIHRALDTSGFVKKEVILAAAERTELFLYDLKMMDSDMHRRWTGVPNELILSNLKLIAMKDVDLIIRIPVIGGVNATVENATATAAFISGLAGKPSGIQLLPYHMAGYVKYDKLGLACPDNGFGVPGKNELDAIAEAFKRHGMPVTVGH